MLVIDIRYPRAWRSGGLGLARGPFPLIMFAPGFMQCDGPYADLLDYWAAAGYAVAAVNFPRTSCRVGAAADEPDLVNQPGTCPMRWAGCSPLARSPMACSLAC